MNHIGNDIYESMIKLESWLHKNNYKAYDPFDGLNAKYLRPLTFNTKVLNQILLQVVRRFPINLRPLLGIGKAQNSKGMGYIARGYLNLYNISEDEEDREKAIWCLDWLKENYSKGYSGYCWGNHFDYQSRVFYLPQGVPTVVWTALIGHSFVDGFEILGKRKYLKVAESACKHIVEDLERYVEGDTVCISYIPTENKQVHNANTLASSLLARVSKHTNNESLYNLARKSIRYTLKYQHQDGSWYYGEREDMRWIDNFHTGYVLDSIKTYIQSTEEKSIKENEELKRKLINGFKYYKNNFFLENGIPKYYNTQTYPIDIQCCSQSIETLVFFSDIDSSALNLARKVALWTIKNMQDEQGFFYFRKYRFITNKTPMLHWGQATMFSALSRLYKVSSMADQDEGDHDGN